MRCDVLTIGDALVDMFLVIQDKSEHCHTNEKKCEVCFTLGAKIPVDDCKFFLGGNACNVSVGLSRLGLKVALVAETGDDAFSQNIITGLKKEKVRLTYLKQTPHTPASFAVDMNFVQDRTIFSRHVTRKHDMDFDDAQCSVIYLTSVGEEWKPLYKKVQTYVQKKEVQLAFNPGSKQLQAGVASFQGMLPLTDILFINKEEAEVLVYGHDQHIAEGLKKTDVLLKGVQKLGPKRVSMTDGNKGSYAIDAYGKIFFQPVIPVPITQRTGVGDAYAAGFLAAVMHKKDIQEAMLWGAYNSAAVLQHYGAQSGLLTKQALLERIEKI